VKRARGMTLLELLVAMTLVGMMAVVASTLTTVAVFVPILPVEEEAGQLFRDIALAICAAVALSLLVSITLIPTLGSRLLKPLAE